MFYLISGNGAQSGTYPIKLGFSERKKEKCHITFERKANHLLAFILSNFNFLYFVSLILTKGFPLSFLKRAKDFKLV